MHAQAILANALLRFQRLESRERAREAGLHARQSGAEQAGSKPPRLALEQFLVLRNGRVGPANHRCHAIEAADVQQVEREAGVKKEPTLAKTARMGHPPARKGV